MTTEVSAVMDSGLWGETWGAGESLDGGEEFGTAVVNLGAKSRWETLDVGRLCCSLDDDDDVGFRGTWIGVVVVVGVIAGRGCCATGGSGFCDCC